MPYRGYHKWELCKDMEWLLDLTFRNWLLAILPLFILLVSIVTGRLTAPRAAILSYCISVGVAAFFFGAEYPLVVVASLKGISLSFFVLAIIWSSVLLYNIVNDVGGMVAIGEHLLRATQDQGVHALLLGWCFAGFIQGVTGFGVPVAVVVPLLVMGGIPAVPATTAALIGHSWAVTFGSLGSSYYSIQLVSGIEGSAIGPTMALMFILPIFMTGFAVAHIAGGMPSVRRLAGLIVSAGMIMAIVSWAMTIIGAPHLASTVAGLMGCAIVWGWLKCFKGLDLQARENFERGAISNPDPKTPSISFHRAFLPYYTVVGLTTIAQLPGLKQFLGRFAWGIDYPATITSYGLRMPAVNDYAAFEIFAHPAPLIIISSMITVLLFRTSGSNSFSLVGGALRKTYRQSISSTVAVAAMVAMALVMQHSGMTEMIAKGLAVGSGVFFPIASPFIGLLGALMTGSNTNSNVMFGALQVEAARALKLSPVIIASSQSVGGSLGSAVTPAKVLLGTTLVGIPGREGDILRQGLKYCLPIVLIVGIETFVASRLF